MGAEIIQAKYEELDTIAARFKNQAEMNAELYCQIERCFQALERDWEGKGATAFCAEMKGEMFPALRRLGYALENTCSITLEISHILQEAEREAAAPFDTNGSTMGVTRAQSSNSTTEVLRAQLKVGLERIHDGAVPAYRLNLNDPAHFDPAAAAAAINTNGRPVLFLIHGINTSDAEARAGFSQASEWYSQTYGHLPESQRPVIIGVDWDSGGVGPNEYRHSNRNSVQAGEAFGRLIRQYNYLHPESRVDAVAHSLGNRLFMEAVRSSDVRVNSYLAVQAAVERDQIRHGGRFEDMLDTNEVAHMGATYTDGDRALTAHEYIAGYHPALGRNARPLLDSHQRQIDIFNLERDDSILDLNHFGYNDDNVRRVTKSFFRTHGGF